MAYKCSFLDNETYIAQDVNDIFARITSGGVVFADTGYTIGDLNNTQAMIATEGVVRDTNSCKVVKTDGAYKVSKGACFMNDGSAIIFDDAGYELEVEDGVLNYVYILRNNAANSIEVVVSKYPGDENSIPLAEIDRYGCVYDRRKYAKSKLDLTTYASTRKFTVNFIKCKPTTSDTVTVDMGDGAFSYLIVWDGERTYNNSRETRYASAKNLIELQDGEFVTLSIGMREGQYDERLYCKKDGQYLHFYLTNPYPWADYTLNLGLL